MKKSGNIKNLNSIADFIFEMGTLRNMRRMHTQVIPNSNDTIASHSFRTAIIAFLLADMEGADKHKVLLTALFHDIPESRTGDANFVHQFYVRQEEKKAYTDQLADVPVGKEVARLLDEYNERETKETIVAKDADILDQLFLEKEVLNGQSKDFSRWHTFTMRKLKTISAKKLARSLRSRNPMQWIYNLSEGLKK